ncbi:Hypothetical predicted protein [Cloeon dipterum]|uniref:Uncharacterized protein n=1 Tax=Cloeon dipterum TaxID=197152 RepID=A0A8S1DXI9_9INSE|nr:Hypothetical predicted protein [Cloeon dipterum]
MLWSNEVLKICQQQEKNGTSKTFYLVIIFCYVLDMYKHCCPVGMKLMEPETTMDFILLRDLSTYFHVAFVGETRSSST